MRLFVALDLPPAVAEALVAWRGPLLAVRDGALRPVAEDALHVTLCFLGERPAEAVAPLAALVEACAEPVAGLALGAPLWLPRRHPRVLAIALDDHHGALGALQARLIAALARDGWHEPESRPYLPHVTVARVRESASDGRLGRVALPPAPALAFEGTALVLYRSHLDPSHPPPRYEAQARVELA